MAKEEKFKSRENDAIIHAILDDYSCYFRVELETRYEIVGLRCSRLENRTGHDNEIVFLY